MNPTRYTIGVCTRKQLPWLLAFILPPENAVIYKKVDKDQYYVGDPNTKSERLEKTYGGYWIYLSSLEVQDHELTEVQEDESFDCL